jgi:hypothetical protein
MRHEILNFICQANCSKHKKNQIIKKLFLECFDMAKMFQKFFKAK